MNTEPRFVKPDDYYNYIGNDLKEELALTDNESNRANLFLRQVEDDLMARIERISFRIYDWDNLSEYQLDKFQQAILLQAEYVIRYGKMMSDSGYDSDKGFVATLEKIQQAALCPTAKDRLVNCGLINHVIKNRRRFLSIGRL